MVTNTAIIFKSATTPNTRAILNTIIGGIAVTNPTLIFKSAATPNTRTILSTIIIWMFLEVRLKKYSETQKEHQLK